MDFSVPRGSATQLARLFFSPALTKRATDFLPRPAHTVRVSYHVQGPKPTSVDGDSNSQPGPGAQAI